MTAFETEAVSCHWSTDSMGQSPNLGVSPLDGIRWQNIHVILTRYNRIGV